MMDRRRAAGVAALGLFLDGVPREPPDALLTIPQGDTARSWSDEPSAAVSADGQSVVFASYARLAAGDHDDRSDIYHLDRASGGVTLESVTRAGRIGSDCARPAVSRDGRYVVFDCAIARGSQPPAIAVVLRDRWTDVAKVIAGAGSSITDSAWTADASISADGRVVVFESTMTGLVPGRDENTTGRDIYLYDVTAGGLRRISVDSEGRQPAAGSSFSPSVSADGRYVAFTSTADLDGAAAKASGASASPGRPLSHIYVRDTQLNVTRRLSVCPPGAVSNGRSWHPAISGDGRYVAFVSDATNLVPGDRNRSSDVFLHDTRTGSTMLVSRGARGGPANGASGLPAISADGGVVAFQSEASDLLCAGKCAAAVEDINLLPDVFLFDRASAVVVRISTDGTGEWMASSVAPALDGSGRVVTFTSRHPTDTGDDGNDFDLFVRVPE
jgi:Tol biopolymer transport system component